MMSLVSHRYESPSSAHERNNISNILEKRTSKFYLNNSQSQTIKELMKNPKKREILLSDWISIFSFGRTANLEILGFFV